MSETSRLLINMHRSITRIVDHIHPDDSTNGDQSDSNFESSIISEDGVSLQDLVESPEFIEEQRLILLEIETARLRIEAECKTPPRRQELDRRSRRSSIGMKLTCPICLESLASVRFSYVKMVTECGHVFCQDCIENVCKAAKNVDEKGFHVEPLCPVCREEVGELRKVYF